MKRLLTVACITAPLLAGACGNLKLWGGPTAEVSIASAETQSVLRPSFTTVVYRDSDPSTIDVYLTDLPMGRIEDLSDKLDGLSGSIVHVSLFLQPSAGKTPIDKTACSASLRQLIIADGAMGVYSGGGFVTTASPGSDTMSGKVRGGTLRLTRGSDDFTDLLGPAMMEGKFVARFNETACRALAQRLQDASFALPRIKPAARTSGE